MKCLDRSLPRRKSLRCTRCFSQTSLWPISHQDVNSFHPAMWHEQPHCSIDRFITHNTIQLCFYIDQLPNFTSAITTIRQNIGSIEWRHWWRTLHSNRFSRGSNPYHPHYKQRSLTNQLPWPTCSKIGYRDPLPLTNRLPWPTSSYQSTTMTHLL